MKALLTLSLIYLAVACQSSGLSNESLAWCRPALPALALATIALWYDGLAAIGFSALMGLLQEGLARGPFGTHIISTALVALLLSSLKAQQNTERLSPDVAAPWRRFFVTAVFIAGVIHRGTVMINTVILSDDSLANPVSQPVQLLTGMIGTGATSACLALLIVTCLSLLQPGKNKPQVVGLSNRWTMLTG